MRHIRGWICALALMAGGAHAQEIPSPAPAGDWRALTEADLTAAETLIRDNHPAMALAMNDPAFIARFNASSKRAHALVPQVTSADGMAAVLRTFATGLGDDHIRWSARSAPTGLRWPGFLVSRQIGAWRVDGVTPDGPPDGARLISCDGTEVATLAYKRLGTHISDPSVEAQQIFASFWLMIDDGNPFVPAPAACRFQAGRQIVQQTLNWRPVTLDELRAARSHMHVAGAAGFGVAPAGKAWWISLEMLDARAEDVLKAVQNKQAELREAPLVVVDVRGNGGGSSPYGDRLAALLLGDAPLKAIEPAAGPPGCESVWRASPGNLKAMRAAGMATPKPWPRR